MISKINVSINICVVIIHDPHAKHSSSSGAPFLLIGHTFGTYYSYSLGLTFFFDFPF